MIELVLARPVGLLWCGAPCLALIACTLILFAFA